MKKSILFAAFAAMIVCSCGAAKHTKNVVAVPTGSDSATGIKATVSEGQQCYAMQEENPAVRSVGSGTHFKEAFAKQTANAQALAEFATKIAAATEAACEEIGVSLEQYAGDNNEGKSVADQSAQSGNLASFVAKQTVKNTSIIKTERYMKNGGQYLVYVCVEYCGTLAELIQETEDKIKEKISEKDRQTLEARHDKFRARMENKMKSL